MEDLGCAVVSQGIVVMSEWKINDAQCAWRDKALQTISHEALITSLRPEI